MTIRTLPLIASICLFICAGASGAEESVSQASDSARSLSGSDTTKATPLLKGGIEHSERLAPVPSYLREGRKYDGSQLEKMTSNNYWFKIPAWLAGQWKEGEYQAVTRTDFDSGHVSPPHSSRSAELVNRFGAQMDKSGQIWEYRACPYNQKVVNADHQLQGYALTTRFEALTPPESPFRILRTFTSTDLHEKSDTIASSLQHEQIQTYTSQDGNSFRYDSSSKEFDQNGEAVSQQVYWQVYTRLAPFKVVNSRDGRDLHMLFREYLTSHGMADLVPNDN